MGSRALAWSAYLFMACQGYLLYAVGFITPYLQSGLAVPPWVAALPNSMLALGILTAGPFVKRIAGTIGPRRAARLWAGLMAIASVLLAIPATILPVLAGAFLLGVSIAGMLVHVVSALGERDRGTLLARAYLWAMVGAIAAPLVLSAASRSVGWAIGPLVPVPILVLLVGILPASPARRRRGPVFLAGLGMSGIMPLGSSLALAHAPSAPIRASARLTAAMGVAVLAAPLVLGLVSTATGVAGAWLLVFALLGGALLVLSVVPRPTLPRRPQGEARAAPHSSPPGHHPASATTEIEIRRSGFASG